LLGGKQSPLIIIAFNLFWEVKMPVKVSTKKLLNQAKNSIGETLVALSLVKNPTKTILRDVSKNGKRRDWRKYKSQSVVVSESYNFYGELEKYVGRMSECGSILVFASCPTGHYKRLIHANFCKARLCTMCQWRRSLVIYHQVFKLVHAHRQHYKSDVPLMLTLTVPNVKAVELSQCISTMQSAFKKLMKRLRVKRAVRSWFRALEITYNEERADYHPHFHVLLMVPVNYFTRAYGLYIPHEEWLELWREAMDMPEITQVDVRRMRKRKQGEIEGVVAEVAKYSTKPSNYLQKCTDGQYKANKGVIRVLHHALKGRRLVGFGGLFVRLRKELKLQDVEKADLLNITDELQDCECPICQSTLFIEMYRWNIGLRNYLS